VYESQTASPQTFPRIVHTIRYKRNKNKRGQSKTCKGRTQTALGCLKETGGRRTDEWVLVSGITIPERTSGFRPASLLSRRQSENLEISV